MIIRPLINKDSYAHMHRHLGEEVSMCKEHTHIDAHAETSSTSCIPEHLRGGEEANREKGRA